MILDARSLPSGYTIESDICIIGAGVAGITLARELADRQFRVCIAESGDLVPDRETQALYRGRTAGHPYYPLDTARVRQFGGSSHRWVLDLGRDRLGGRLRPLDRIDFEERDWVPHSGWPFRRSHLDPYYERAQTICKAGPFCYDVQKWEDRETTPRLSLTGDGVETAIYQAVRREVFNKEYPHELERLKNVTVYLHANALEIETTENAQIVTRVRAACLDGKKFSITAKLFVVAVGGIETPRLLLLSNKAQRSGLGNQHDLVGRFFMEHPHLWSGLYVPSDRTIFKATKLYEPHWVDGVPILAQLKISEDLMRRERMLNYSLCIRPSFRPRASAKKRAVTQGLGAIRALASALRRGDVNELNTHLSTLFPVVNDLSIAAYRRTMRVLNKLLQLRRFEIFLLNHMVEQAPHPESRVFLIDERDRFGQNRVCLNWRLSPIDIRSIICAQQIIDENLQRSGLGRLQIDLEDETPPPDLHGGWHHMGTTRMHVDPKKGVVDANCKVHGIANLYIAGPSVFPTGGCANPVLTIVALAVRLADHLKKTLA